tara:strand:- start:21968 stop:22303 length:336 start_codon:yes stop_codon:yes gene_type:complete
MSKDSELTITKIVASCLGALLTLLAAGFFGSLWQLSNTNASNDHFTNQRIDKMVATQSALADEIGNLKAEVDKAHSIEDNHPEISAEDVRNARESVQQTIDKAAARQDIIK